MLCQKKKEKAKKISDRVKALHDLYKNIWWNVQLTSQQWERLNSLLETFTKCEASAINPLQYEWEMELCYPNNDLKHKVRGSISEEDEVLMKLKDFVLEILIENVSNRYPSWLIE